MIFSIRKRLLLLLLASIGIVWSVVTWQVYTDTQHEVEELFDANLSQNAKILLTLIKQEIVDHKKIELAEYGHRYEHKLAFLIRSNTGKILLRSVSTPLFPIFNSNSYHDYRSDKHLWRVFTLQTEDFLIQTGERYDIRNELIEEIIESTLTSLLMALPFLAILIWISVGNSFKSLQQITNEISTKNSTQLQTLQIHKLPIEIKPLTDAINNLFIRLSQAFENERRFTADAAHELRTPLAGLKIQSQVALRATEPEQLHQALEQINTSVDRTTRLIEQLLALARMDATQKKPFTSIDMYVLLSQLIVDLTPQALDKDIDLGLETTAKHFIVIGNQEHLYLLYRNLIDNAIRYTPKNGQVTVTLQNSLPNQLIIAILDTGCGIPTDQQQQVFKRFYRGKQQNTLGSGLGLSIVNKIAKLYQIEIQLENMENGLQVITYLVYEA
ncbi:ATP-binding protein [Candidatus Halobeggiatoa sp. HSG11]|nr:ATP-binding protein [Candidatus Halobeggiatoa sp. HSG11]